MDLLKRGELTLAELRLWVEAADWLCVRELYGTVVAMWDGKTLEGEIELEPGVESYKFVDASLESRSEIEKQLLRLGPENLRRLQMKLRRIAATLEMD